MINQIWVADAKSWSQRIWDNTEKLVETLNENLIYCVATGKKTTELKNLLERIDKGLLPFNSEVVLSDFAIYCNLKEQAKRKTKKHQTIAK